MGETRAPYETSGPLRSEDDLDQELAILKSARDLAWANIYDLGWMIRDCQRRIRERDRAAREG